MSQKAVSQKSTSTKQTQFTKSAPKKVTPKTFLAEDFHIKNFGVTEAEVNERSKSQLLAYPRYNDATVRFQTSEFTISQYGLAPIGEYAKSDDDYQRKQLKLVLDPNQQGCVELNNMFTSIDKYMVDNQKKIFSGKFSKLKYVYKSIVREPQTHDELIDDEEDTKKTTDKEKKEKKEKYNFWKAKLDTDFDTGKILTSVFVRDPENLDAKPKRVPVETPTQLEQFFRWGCKVRMIVMMNKMWADKQPKEQGVDRKYGIGFKVMSLEITPSERQGSFRTEVQNYAFIDKNGEGEGEEVNEENNNEQVEENNNAQDEEQDNEDQENDDQEAEGGDGEGDGEGGEEGGEEEEEQEEQEEEEEEVEEVPQPKAKAGGKKSAPAPVVKAATTKGKSKK